MSNNKKHSHVIEQVPKNYYQKGIEDNFLQRIWHTEKLDVVVSLVGGEPKNILDVGCASGWFIFEISKKYPHAKCFGIDLYESAIIYGRKKYKKIKFSVSDAHKLPYKKRMFDLILCTEVMEHVDDPELVLREIKRVLKSGGEAIIELDSGSLLFSLAWFLWKKTKGRVWKNAHNDQFNLKKLERMIKKANLSIKNKKTFNLGMAVAYRLQKK